MDYIYKRRNFKINVVRKVQKVRLAMLAFLFIIILVILMYVVIIFPLIRNSCKIKASSVAINIVNEEVGKIMAKYNYEDLVKIDRTENGKVSSLNTNVIPINNIVSNVVINIQKRLDEKRTEKVSVNLGKVTNIYFFSYISPVVAFELERSGKVKANVQSEFEEVGINQTLHKLNLVLDCSVNIVTPLEIINDNINTKVVLAETVIVGEVPNVYEKAKENPLNK